MLLLIISLLELKTLLQHTDELLAFELFELCDGIFVNGVDKKENFKVLLEDLRNRELQVAATNLLVRW